MTSCVTGLNIGARPQFSRYSTEFGKGRGTRDRIANIHWVIEKATESKENIYFCFIDYAKAFDCVDHNKQWKIPKVMGPPYLPPEKPVCRSKATVRTRHA